MPSDASFLCIPKVGVNAVKSICGNQWLHNNIKKHQVGATLQLRNYMNCMSVGVDAFSVHSIALTMHVHSRGSSLKLEGKLRATVGVHACLP